MSRGVTEPRIRQMPADGTTRMKSFDERADNEKDCVPCA